MEPASGKACNLPAQLHLQQHLTSIALLATRPSPRCQKATRGLPSVMRVSLDKANGVTIIFAASCTLTYAEPHRQSHCSGGSSKAANRFTRAGASTCLRARGSGDPGLFFRGSADQYVARVDFTSSVPPSSQRYGSAASGTCR